MTTLVTRLYDNPAHADAVVAALKAEGFPDSALTVVEQSGARSAEETIEAAGLPESIARQYAQHLTSKRALLVVRAPFVPFGAARKAIDTADLYPSFNAGVANQNLNIPDEPDPSLFRSILGSHRLFLTNSLDVRNDLKPRGLSNAFGISTLSERAKKIRPSVIRTQAISYFFLPFALISRRRSSSARMLKGFASQMFMPIPLISGHREPRNLRHYRITN